MVKRAMVEDTEGCSIGEVEEVIMAMQLPYRVPCLKGLLDLGGNAMRGRGLLNFIWAWWGS